jgi:acetylornithine deacetylase/succinyl-diaminopimelate desuccinylase-like protein
MIELMQAVSDRLDVDGLVKLAAEMVRFPSQIPNEGPLGEFLAAEMRRSGCYDQVILQPVVTGRYNVIGIVRGSGGGTNLLLNGHLDIPTNFGAWTRDPYEPAVEGDWLYGSGSTDMKGAVACMIKAGEALAGTDLSRKGDLIVSCVIHHDVCGLGTKFFLDSNDRRLDLAINGEPTNLKVQVAHGGAWQFELMTKGRAAHSSRQENGIDAIEKMVKVLAALRQLPFTFDRAEALPGLPRLVVGIIDGGSTASTVAETCTAKGDVRIVPSMTADSLRADVERLISRLASDDPELEAEVRTLTYQRPFRVGADTPLVRLVADLHALATRNDAEISADLPVAAYVTDSSDLALRGIPTVIYGPGDWRQDPDERIRIPDMVVAAKVYASAAAFITTQGLPGI